MEESMPQDEIQELVREFIVETEDVLEGLDKCFIELEGAPGDMVLINEIFRAVHNVKGSASFLGFNQLVEVAHQSENVLNRLRQNSMQATAEIIDVILESVDVLKKLVKELKENSGEIIDIESIKGKLLLLVDKPSEQTESPEQEKPDDKALGISEHEKGPTLRIDTNRLDHVMDLVGELVLGRNRLTKIITEIEELHDGDDRIKSLLETVSSMNLVTTDLQLSVMKMRMIPIRKAFNKFPKMVRDTARKADKKVNLRIYGEATEVDKSVIAEIRDPLVHIIRNSIDHGIEPPAERLRMNKPEFGTIILGAFQEGNFIVIQIEDDGKGIDPAVIERKAREKGLITSNDVKLLPREVLNFIFEPGFSTSEKVSDISGRGVGMDVVKTNIGRMNGIIDIHSEVNKGTRITLKIPLTLAIIQVLMVKTNGSIYALPLSSILENVRVSRDCIKSVDGQKIMNVRDELIPVVRLGDILGTGAGDASTEYIYVVVLALAEKRVGIIVDELCHQEEVVIKSVGNYFSDISEISGATITGDGQVGLILDPSALICRRSDLAGMI